MAENGKENGKVASELADIPEKRPDINIHRSALTLADFPELTAREEPGTCATWLAEKAARCKSSCACSGECLKKKAATWFPFLGVLRSYKVREWLLLDIVAGLTIGIMHVPQGMGFAMLARLPPIYGLYTSFFPVLVYFLFTSSRHTSFGTMSLVAMMLGSVVEREVRTQLYIGVDV